MIKHVYAIKEIFWIVYTEIVDCWFSWGGYCCEKESCVALYSCVLVDWGQFRKCELLKWVLGLSRPD